MWPWLGYKLPSHGGTSESFFLAFISVLLPLLIQSLNIMSAEPTTTTTAPAATDSGGDALDKGVAFVSGKTGHKLVNLPPTKSYYL